MKIAQIEAKLIDSMGSDLSVVNAARVSFDKESEWEIKGYEQTVDIESRSIYEFPIQELAEKDKKLINYLAKHKHFSPFNHTFLSFRVKAPIYVARQLVKHEYLPWNEVSRRYVSSEPDFAPITFRWASENKKQGSGDEMSPEVQATAQAMYWDAIDIALDTYQNLLDLGVCPEQARTVLPLNTNTEWIWSGTLKAFHKMIDLRLDPHAQKEAQLVAEQIKEQIMPLFPVSLNALLEHK